MAMAIVVFGLGSLIFLSAAVIGVAIVLRGQWSQIGERHTPPR